MQVSVYLLEPLSDVCRKWIHKNIDSAWPGGTMAGGVAVECDFLNDALTGLKQAGFMKNKDFETEILAY